MRRTIILLAAIFLAIAVVVPAFAQQNLPPDPSKMSGRFSATPPGDFILLDALILRPLGLAAMAVGAIGAVAATPWAEASHSEDRVKRELIEKPYWYTFCRPLGDSDF
ncbi:MAG: hypothetical protein M0Z81_12505 [Deltaproteobacteria bacterium]|nr:hypothetical protein [Deltaproteobacteria bacterium]